VGSLEGWLETNYSDRGLSQQLLYNDNASSVTAGGTTLTELLAGAVGGFAAAFFTLLLSEIWRRRTERSKAIIALATELALNLRTACKVLDGNVKYLGTRHDQHPWWTILGFSDASWRTVVNAGSLSRLDPVLNSPLAEAYAFLLWADYAAQKLQTGQVSPRKAKNYTVRTFEAGERADRALAELQLYKPYKRILKRVPHLQEASEAWSDGVSIWSKSVNQSPWKTAQVEPRRDGPTVPATSAGQSRGKAGAAEERTHR